MTRNERFASIVAAGPGRGGLVHDEATRLRAFVDDLLAELESITETADRCRWPVDEPWPQHH